VLPYEQYLKRFPAYLQQLTMESNGKSITLDGKTVALSHRSDFLGRAGDQRPALVLSVDPSGDTKLIPCDFIAFAKLIHPVGPHHDMLLANVFAQAEALAFGKTPEQVKAEGTPDWLVPHRVFEGNRPSNVYPGRAVDARDLGKLVALYEHSRLHPGRDLGASTRSINGASNWAKCWPSASFRSWNAPPSRSSRMTARPTT
jgi:glucose-6-phosphate isomerase